VRSNSYTASGGSFVSVSQQHALGIQSELKGFKKIVAASLLVVALGAAASTVARAGCPFWCTTGERMGAAYQINLFPPQIR
jgi:hypothetical protein